MELSSFPLQSPQKFPPQAPKRHVRWRGGNEGRRRKISFLLLFFIFPPSIIFLSSLLSFPQKRNCHHPSPPLFLISHELKIFHQPVQAAVRSPSRPPPPSPFVRVIAAAAAFQPPVRSELRLLRHQGLFFHLQPLWGSWGRRWREKRSMHSHNKQLGPSADIPIDPNTPLLIRHHNFAKSQIISGSFCRRKAFAEKEKKY